MSTLRDLLSTAALCLAITSSAQHYTDIHALLEMDLRNEKDTIVMTALGLSDEQRILFMPIYRDYSAALKAHREKRAALIDDYAEAKEALDDAKAASFMKRLTALEQEFISIRDTHARQLGKVLPMTIAARWVQIERRLNQLLELQVANEMPLMPAK